ncbi:MAG: tetratricopeptide repeat protein [Muribaculaceae bacterium]|nr:tetratricopeptide repeat protein [Muribaculaceae bacterium]
MAAASLYPCHAQINTDQVIRVGTNALHFEDYLLSIQYFNQAIQAKPYLAQPYLLRALAKLNLEDYAGAEEDASRAIELNPYITDAYEVRGVARQNRSDNDGAIADYKHALTLLPRNRQLLFNLALAQTDSGHYTDARESYRDLISYYPNFANAYLGRSRLNSLCADTLNARADIDTAITLDPKNFTAYAMRADLALQRGGKENFMAAAEDIDRAIILNPQNTGMYINRAFIRYQTDDFFGAIADYDYALRLDPDNVPALTNRALVLTELNDDDRALEDYNRLCVINPGDVSIHYNRAVILARKGHYSQAAADATAVIEAMPDFPGGYYLRSDIYRQAGRSSAATADMNRARKLADRLAANPVSSEEVDQRLDRVRKALSSAPDDLVPSEFNTVKALETETRVDEEFNNSAIRGRVQDRNVAATPEPRLEMAFYYSPGEISENTLYFKEIDLLNATRRLRHFIVVTNALPPLDPETLEEHFHSISDYTSYMANHTPVAADYLARAMDYVTVRDYENALLDVNRALALTPDFTPAYMLRAQINHKLGALEAAESTATGLENLNSRLSVTTAELADLETVLTLAPLTAPAWYNKGCALLDREDYTAAIAAFSRAAELAPTFGPAFYNRGFAYLRLGNLPLALADLGKAGELGVAGAYNLIKRVSR